MPYAMVQVCHVLGYFLISFSCCTFLCNKSLSCWTSVFYEPTWLESHHSFVWYIMIDVKKEIFLFSFPFSFSHKTWNKKKNNLLFVATISEFYLTQEFVSAEMPQESIQIVLYWIANTNTHDLMCLVISSS